MLRGLYQAEYSEIIPALGSLNREDCELKGNLSCIMRLCLQSKGWDVAQRQRAIRVCVCEHFSLLAAPFPLIFH